MTTVTAIKRALEETTPILRADPDTAPDLIKACQRIMHSDTALTILANRLSDRGEAGNAATQRNLLHLQQIIIAYDNGNHDQRAALNWAIDQLTPPEPATLSYEEGAAKMMRIKHGLEE